MRNRRRRLPVRDIFLDPVDGRMIASFWLPDYDH
jgi:hypothetical protein